MTALLHVLEGIADGRFAVAGPVVAGLEVALDDALDACAAVLAAPSSDAAEPQIA